MRPKRELVRVVRSPQGEIGLDPTLKAPGRGAYLCPDEACLAAAAKRRSLGRALKVQIPPEVIEQLGREIAEGGAQGPGRP